MQAARGTPLTSGDEVPVTAPPPPARRRWGIFAVVALTAYAVDVVTKILAVDRLSGEPDVPLLGDWFSLTLVRNPGAAFSTGTGHTYVFSSLALVAVLVVLWVSRRVATKAWAIALGLLLAGVAGNLTDRLFRAPGPMHGHVIDFFRLPNWPVFNVADICINVAAGLIILQAIRGVSVDGRTDRDRQPA
jgi:signal peptidase II